MAKPQHFAPLVKKHLLAKNSPEQKSYTWTVHSIDPFDELLISWNAQRPCRGQYVILTSLHHRHWSPWLLYAVWGAQGQYSFHDTTFHSPVQTYQDQVQLLEGQQAKGFRIRIEACGGASLEPFSTLFSCTSQIQAPKEIYHPTAYDGSIDLPLEGLSQLCLCHPRAASLCSPTSVACAVHYLTESSKREPLDFAKDVYDSGFDIYGNWAFNASQIFVELGSKWQSYCARLPSFASLLEILKKGYPVIVSVKGQLTGSLKPYASGHLIVVRGYLAKTQKVLCMDPAFLSDERTLTSYPLDEFIQAWGNRYNLAYVIGPE